MVVSGGPSIVDEGLLLHLDAADKIATRNWSTWYDISVMETIVH